MSKIYKSVYYVLVFFLFRWFSWIKLNRTKSSYIMIKIIKVKNVRVIFHKRSVGATSEGVN